MSSRNKYYMNYLKEKSIEIITLYVIIIILYSFPSIRFRSNDVYLRWASGTYLYAYLRSLSNSIRLRVFAERPHEVQ